MSSSGFVIIPGTVTLFSIPPIRSRARFFTSRSCYFIPFDICLVYFNFYFLIPRFLKTKKYIAYACLIFTAVFIDACIDASIRQFYNHMGSQLFPKTPFFNLASFSGAMAARFLPVGTHQRHPSGEAVD
ncbi:MAG: hypothetical protein WDM78_03080 [Puia sp.]